MRTVNFSPEIATAFYARINTYQLKDETLFDAYVCIEKFELFDVSHLISYQPVHWMWPLLWTCLVVLAGMCTT